MQLCVRTDACGNDPERVASYSLGLGENQIWAFPQLAECYGENGLMQPARLEAYHERLRRRGLRLRLVTETIADEDVAAESSRRTAAARLRSVLTAMQAAAVESLFLIITVAAGDDEGERGRRWDVLAELYREIVPYAEATGRRLANHGHQTAQHLIFSAADMERLLAAAPSACSGLTFCTGCYHLAGDDLGAWLERFGKDRIFLVHARDVRRRSDGSPEDTRYGEGEINLRAVIAQLKALGYQGLVCPEHVPRVEHDRFEEISSAWGLGHLRALLAE